MLREQVRVHFFPKVQTKLSVGKADDAFEKEADNVADKVVSQSGEGAAIQKKEGPAGLIQEKPIDSITPIQKMEGAEEEKEPAVQKQEEQGRTTCSETRGRRTTCSETGRGGAACAKTGGRRAAGSETRGRGAVGTKTRGGRRADTGQV